MARLVRTPFVFYHISNKSQSIFHRRPGSFYTIRLGEHNRYLIEGTEQDITGRRVIKHPDYNKPSTIYNDIALIQLSRPATLNAKVGLVCLPSSDENVSSAAKCYITGWKSSVILMSFPDFLDISRSQKRIEKFEYLDTLLNFWNSFMNAVEHYFHVMLFIRPCKVALRFGCVDKS